MDTFTNFLNGTITLFSDPLGIVIFFGGVIGGMYLPFLADGQIRKIQVKKKNLIFFGFLNNSTTLGPTGMVRHSF